MRKKRDLNISHNDGPIIEMESRIDSTIRRTSITLKIKELPSDLCGYKISALTDFHYGCYTNPSVIKKCLEITKNENPDLILMLGDFVHSGRQKVRLAYLKLIGMRKSKYREYRRLALQSAKSLSELFSQLTPKDGIYSVWGNHDYIEGIWILKSVLPKTIHHLKNQNALISKKVNGKDFTLGIYGLDDIREGEPVMEGLSNPDFKNADFKIFLSHNPDFVKLKNHDLAKDVDIILSGHTHGGQVCLPGQIPMKTETKQRKYYAGGYRFGRSLFYISNGIGCSSLPIRLFCPPEIVTITLNTQ